MMIIRLLFKVFFYLSVLIILYLATTTVEIKSLENSWDKLNHFFAFFVLYVLLSFSFKNLTITSKIIILTFYAFLIEIIQYFIPNRDFSLLDIFADFIGLIFAMLLLFFLKKLFNFDYKLEQGYSKNEVMSKYMSLRGVLEPFSTQGNIDMLKRAGFVDINSIFKYVPFEGFLAIK